MSPPVGKQLQQWWELNWPALLQEP